MILNVDVSSGNSFANWTNPYVTVHFKCRICAKELPKSSYWKKHYSFHSDERQFQCSACGKSFKQSCDLKRHEKIHSQVVLKQEMNFSMQPSKQETFF